MATERGKPTNTEARLAEQYVSVLDFVSRCAQAIDHGDWFYLYDKASELVDVAGRLARIAGETWDEISVGKFLPCSEAMRAAVAQFGRHYRAARLLHPLEPGREESER